MWGVVLEPAGKSELSARSSELRAQTAACRQITQSCHGESPLMTCSHAMPESCISLLLRLHPCAATVQTASRHEVLISCCRFGISEKLLITAF